MLPNNYCGCLMLSYGLFLAFSFTVNGAALSRYEALMRQQSQEILGLYNTTDRVYILSDVNFQDIVLHQNRSTVVEFYNSYCGHCKRFAPLYKLLADQCYPWRELMLVTAIDCAAEENNGICREYEVMGYPTLRYFGPSYEPTDKNFGRTIDTQELDEIRTLLAEWVAIEKRNVNMTNWPDFNNLTSVEASKKFSEIVPTDRDISLLILVYEVENTTTGIEMILQFHRWPAVYIRRITDPEVAAKFDIGDDKTNKIAMMTANGEITRYSITSGVGAAAYANIIRDILQNKQLQERPEQTTVVNKVDRLMAANGQNTEEIIQIVHRNKHSVYQADLEMAIRGILFNEIPKIRKISGERLHSLKLFMSLLKRYHVLGSNGRQLIEKMNDYVMQFNKTLTGKEFETELDRLYNENEIFSTDTYVGCAASQPGLRGYTCSLWMFFHSMTIQAANTDHTDDPLEVLEGIHGYVKHFFGCTNCAQHFQEMAKRRQLWNVQSKNDAILWLWSAHNEVNQRLKGDDTEDPKFPKKVYPTAESCPLCYRSAAESSTPTEVGWNKEEVLNFLHTIHTAIDKFGTNLYIDSYTAVSGATAERLRQKRMIGNVFSDIVLGVLLYGFCIIMMVVVALKLFAFKGYRKKPYTHDLIGKV